MGPDTNDCADQNDAQSWYLLGRCYMAQQKYPKAYEAYQQAVYRDGRNPTFWCSIGVLYYQINQYRDALDAYSRAIRLNPNISEVWYDLGTLVRGIQITLVLRTADLTIAQYESCNNQTADALDAYQRAADLDPTNVHIKARLQLLQNGQPTSGMPNQNSAPLPQDVHPQAYQPAAVNGPPGPQWGAPAPSQAPQSQPPPALDYGRRLADIQQHPQPVQQLTPYDQRDGVRPIPPPPPRPASPSPRQDPMRQYPEPPRANVTPRRGMSPSPKSQNAAPPYGAPPSVPLPPPPPLSQSQSAQVNRIANPNYGPGAAIPPLPPPPPRDPSPHGPMSMHTRITPPPEVRPIMEQRPSSAGSGPYAAHGTGPPGIAAGAPPPASAQAAAEEAARNRVDDRSSSGPKRLREYEEDHKVLSNDEKRPRLDEHGSRPPSVTDRHPSSNNSPSTARRSLERAEDHRRAIANSENYHPSEAAHHHPPPSSLPALNATTPNGAAAVAAAAAAAAASSGPAPYPPMADAPPTIKGEEPRGDRAPLPGAAAVAAGAGVPQAAQPRVEEPPVRTVVVDEDYDGEGDGPADKERPKGEGSPAMAAAA